MKNASLFGVPILIGEKSQLEKTAKSLLHRHGILHTVNPLMLSYALTDSSFRKVLRDGVNIPDGVGVKYALAWRNEKTDVIPGIDLAESLFQETSTVVFYGGKPGVASAAFSGLCRKFDKKQEALVLNGYTTTEKEASTAVARAKPELVFVALGTPKQERTVQKLYDAYPHALYIGVGGAFDIWAGNKKRAAPLVRKCGLEWAYRLLSEPKRLKNCPRLILFSVISLITAVCHRFHRKQPEKRSVPSKFPNKNIVKN